jgi:two-component SAPR family response regulator
MTTPKRIDRLSRITSTNNHRKTTALQINTLGGFRVWRDGLEIKPVAWGREKAVHLFQYLLTNRRRQQHKELIIDQLWPSLDPVSGDRDFKVALNAINKALEPERAPRTQTRFIQRFDLAYGLNNDEIWVDADAFEMEIETGNQALIHDIESSIKHFQAAVKIYQGDYLPERRYEDWTSVERERLQTLALATMTSLANLLVDQMPLESIRLTQRVLSIDKVWEEAYRVQMRAYMSTGNRPLALRTYQQCVEVLMGEFGIEPLPETKNLKIEIEGKS